MNKPRICAVIVNNDFIPVREIEPLVEAHILRMSFCRLRSLDDHVFKGWFSEFHVVSVCSGNRHGERYSVPVNKQFSFCARF